MAKEVDRLKAQLEAAESLIADLRAESRDRLLTIGLLLDKLGGRVEITEREIVELDTNRLIMSTPDRSNGLVILEIKE